MFRKLFISLLILSALTSEGISALPSSYTALSSISANEVGILAELNASANQEQAKARSSISDAFSGHAFVLTKNSVEKLKYKNSYLITSEAENNSFLRASSDSIGLQPDFGAQKEESYSRSGLSPPVDIV